MDSIEQFYGLLLGDNLWPAIVGAGALFLALGYLGLPLFVWAIAILAAAVGFAMPVPGIIAVAVVLAVFLLPPLRSFLVTTGVMKVFNALKLIPKISATERTALEAGVVWSEAELFSGKPNFRKMVHDQMYPRLTDEEQAFIDGPLSELCEMVDDWQVWKERKISDEAFKFIKEKGFLGMIIPKEYGGLGFSNLMHSEVIQTLSTRSISVGITVMVPNSLGPAELLLHYGTDTQKKHHLPRLASGEDVPCFGLTEPQAGSDAGSITSAGVVFKGDDGRLKIRLNWNKRWITLAAISSTIGLAFKLFDPDNLLGQDQEDIGITCVLISSKAEGVVIGRRHDPLTVPFYNCPTQGHDVVVDAEEAIIGGTDMAGKGWGMLMESLAAGRGISLPAQSTGGVKLTARVATNHSLIRKQFGISIGKFEGVEEPLARIVGGAYFTEAMRLYTLSALDQGIKPPVVTAIAKYCATETFRSAVNDGMDVCGGQAISLGSRNLLGVPYIAAPIGITVEGANILTRTLIIFGQGAMRAHPFAFKEVDALGKGDVKAFDGAFWGHVGHIVRNLCRSIVLSFTRGFFVLCPSSSGTKRYYQKLAWTSASFAILADVAMGVLGGKLKVKEKITGRFADILSWMYIATSVLHRYEGEGRKKEDLPFVHYSMQVAFYNIQQAFDGLFANFDAPVIGWILKGPIRWWSSFNVISRPPSDALGHKLVSLMMKDSAQRDRMTAGVYFPKDVSSALGKQEKAFKAILAAADAERKVKKAIRRRELPKKAIVELIDTALEKKIISNDEAAKLKLAAELRWDVIQVDDFSEDEYVSPKAHSAASQVAQGSAAELSH